MQNGSFNNIVMPMDSNNGGGKRVGINGMVHAYTHIWVIPCQLTHFFPGPSPILMKFVILVDPSDRLTHTEFQLIIIIIDEAAALQRFLEFFKIFDFVTQNIL